MSNVRCQKVTEALYAAALKNMSSTVHELARQVPQPKTVPFADSFVYRYVEKTPRQAIVQKLARYVTTLRAACILFDHGFVQEQAALQRMLDEIQEDVTFLAFGLIFNKLTPLHETYLAAFYQEEFDPITGKPGDQDRPMPPRKKIRAYIARMEGAAADPSRGVDVTRQVSKAYSGYVHAASPQIMDMYGGSPLRFHLRARQVCYSTRHLWQHGRQQLMAEFLLSWTIFAGIGVKKRRTVRPKQPATARLFIQF